MEELIAIALFYSYVVNRERRISDYRLGCFIDAVKKELVRIKSDYDINSSKASNYFDIIPCSIIVSCDDKDYLLSDIKDDVSPFKEKYMSDPICYYRFGVVFNDFLNWFNSLDRDLVCATLADDALEYLDIKRESLPIKISRESRTGTIGIYSLVESEARESAISALENYGFSDISVGRGVPTQPDDKAYRFYFSAMRDMSSLDCYNEAIFKPISDLITILELEDDKAKLLDQLGDDAKISLNDRCMLAKTVLLDDDNNAVDKKYVAVLQSRGDELYPTSLFINLLGDEVMRFFYREDFDSKKFQRVVEDVIYLSKGMKSDKVTLEEIEKYVDLVNKKPIMKELKPDKKD